MSSWINAAFISNDLIVWRTFRKIIFKFFFAGKALSDGIQHPVLFVIAEHEHDSASLCYCFCVAGVV
jgi:hypothetical protein